MLSLLVFDVRADLISAGADPVKTFRVFEIAASANAPAGLPYKDGPSVTATFAHTSGATIVAKGFWDGANIWRIRFAPTLPGTWTWTTASTDAGLNSLTGGFAAATPNTSELQANPLLHGFLQRNGYSWRLSDGTWFLPVGDTQWSFSEEFTLAEFQAWMNALQARHLNSMHGCAWLGKFTRGGLLPFIGLPRDDNLAPAYFQRLDQMVQYANDHGIMMGICIGGFPVNTEWWSDKFPTQAEDDRWFRYIVARYAAFNVRWVLYGEVDERNPPWGTWQSEVAHKAQLVKDEDPYDHPIGSHTLGGIDTSSIGNANIDYAEAQQARNETQYQKGESYRQYGKPIWFEEYWYEPKQYDDGYSLGIRNTHRNFIAAMVFPSFGSLMRAHSSDSDFPPTKAAQQGADLTS